MNIKALRGEILDFLHRISPRIIDELEIIGVFYQYYKDNEIRSALLYLADRGYIKVIEEPHPYKPREKKRFYTITADGIDVLDLTKQDNGIIVPERRD